MAVLCQDLLGTDLVLELGACAMLPLLIQGLTDLDRDAMLETNFAHIYERYCFIRTSSLFVLKILGGRDTVVNHAQLQFVNVSTAVQ